MNTYYLRTTDYPTLLQLGEMLGVISLHYEAYTEEGEPIGEPTVVATDGGYDYIGEIALPSDDPEAAPEYISNADGVPYIHANLITPHDIRSLAVASDDPVIQAALGQIAAFFVADEDGNARAPALPHRVFA